MLRDRTFCGPIRSRLIFRRKRERMRFTDAEMDLFTAMSVTAQRPLNWNVLTIDAADTGRTAHQLAASDRAAAAGGRVVALTMPTLVGMNMSFRTYCALFLLPGWRDVLDLDLPERMERLRDPEVRRTMDAQAHSKDAGVVGRLAGWGRYVIGDTFAPENEALRGRTVADKLVSVKIAGRLACYP